jgi:hypothetical protein
MRRRIVVGLTCIALGAVAPIGAANASPKPPTNGGNGAGSSGQCTGNPDLRPAVCPGT